MFAKPLTTSRYIRALWVWTILSTSLIVALNLNPHRPVGRAVLLMGGGLVLFWVVLGGILMHRFRNPIRGYVQSIRLWWPLKFFLFCTLLALLEEAVTVTMTNLAPVFGVPIGAAYITASANYLDVVLFHSVIVFLPWFFAWAWMLSRWRFHPNTVFILFGITGTLAEMGFGGPQHVLEYGMWTFVYGLMIYLPAYCVPDDRRAVMPPGWAFPAAVFIPWVFMVLCFPLALPYGAWKSRVHGNQAIDFPPMKAAAPSVPMATPTLRPGTR